MHDLGCQLDGLDVRLSPLTMESRTIVNAELWLFLPSSSSKLIEEFDLFEEYCKSKWN